MVYKKMFFHFVDCLFFSFFFFSCAEVPEFDIVPFVNFCFCCHVKKKNHCQDQYGWASLFYVRSFMALGPMFQSLKDLLIFKFWLKFYKTKQRKATTIKASCRTSNYFWYLNVSLGSWVGHFCSGGLKSGFTSRRIIGICPLPQRIWRLGKE